MAKVKSFWGQQPNQTYDYKLDTSGNMYNPNTKNSLTQSFDFGNISSPMAEAPQNTSIANAMTTPDWIINKAGTDHYRTPSLFNGNKADNAVEMGTANGTQESPSWYSGLMNPDKIGENMQGLGSIGSAIGGLYSAYTNQKYQNRAQQMQESAIARMNQRQDLAQSNYNKSMGS